MDADRMLILLSAATMKKVTTYHSLFGPDLVRLTQLMGAYI